MPQIATKPNTNVYRTFRKTVRLGTAKTYGGRTYSTYARIEFTEGKLSICGVEGPLPSGNCLGGCGQIDMHLKAEDLNPAPGWTRNKIRDFLNVWNLWHLNDMKAECEHQRARGETWKTHPEAICPDCGYKLGSAWLREEVPADVVDFLLKLPNTDKQPAWV